MPKTAVYRPVILPINKNEPRNDVGLLDLCLLLEPEVVGPEEITQTQQKIRYGHVEGRELGYSEIHTHAFARLHPARQTQVYHQVLANDHVSLCASGRAFEASGWIGRSGRGEQVRR